MAGSDEKGRTTTQVIYDHLARRLAGDVEGDIETNYAKDVLILSSFSTFRGHDGVRQSAAQLAEVGAGAEFSYNRTVIEDEYAFLEWTASRHGSRTIQDGSDSFRVIHGRIVMQSIHYTALPQT